MANSRWSGRFKAALKTASPGLVSKVVFIRAIAYGTKGQITSGISSANPRTEASMTLVSESIGWRTLSAGIKSSIVAIGDVVFDVSRETEFSFTIGGSTAANGIDPAALHGVLPNHDVQYMLIQADTLTTAEHGMAVDGCAQPSTMSRDGMEQTVTPGGSLAGQQWTFSVLVARPDQTITTTQSVRMAISLGDLSEAQSSNVTYTGAGKYQVLSATKTFSGAPSVNTIKVTCGPVGVTPLLIVAAQLEQAGARSTYERTSEVAAGTVNKLLNSHFPCRTGWTPTAITVISSELGRGPEIRSIVPTPGTAEFSTGLVGSGFQDGRTLFVPIDGAQVADKLSSTATGRAGIYRVRTGMSPAGKTYLASAWVRHTGSNIPTTVGIMLSPQNNVGTHLYDDIQEWTPTKAWRRVWWVTYVDPSFSTADRMEAFFFSNDAASGKDSEWYGFQLEEIAGDNPRPPLNYEPTTSADGATNLLQRSEEADNGYWSRQNVNVTANTGYAPSEYYSAVHPDRGAFQIRINQWNINPSLGQSWQWPETSLNGGDNLFGELFSIGAYGTEKIGSDGDFTTWAAGSPNGWTRNGTTGNITQATALPNYWNDDDDGATASGVAIAIGPSDSNPTSNLQKTVALTAGWHTLRLKAAGLTNALQSDVRVSLKRSTDNLYLDQDCVRVRQASETWIKTRVRYSGANKPDFGTIVWHFYVPTTTNYVLRIGAIAFAAATGVMYIDQARIWDNAGALYQSGLDRTETKGSMTCVFQGANLLWRGVVDETTDGDVGQITVRCLGYPTGTDQLILNRTTKPECQLAFRGPECGYISSTTFTGASGGGSTHQVASTADLRAGRYIVSRSGASYLKILLIVDATHFTTDAGDTFVNGDLCVYGECRHSYSDCSIRKRTHMYAGFRGTAQLQALVGSSGFDKWMGPNKAGGMPNPEYDGPHEGRISVGRIIGAITIKGQERLGDKQIFDDRVIPVLYGRKGVKLIPIESHATKIVSDGNSEWLTTFYAMSYGEIDAIRSFFTPDGPIIHDPAKGIGVYWHPGTIGEDAWWTAADHLAALATQKIPNQRRDFRTNTDTAYSRVAYAILMIKKGNPLADLNDPTKIKELWADGRWKKVQSYDAYGRAQGLAWSQNPIWCAVDAMLNAVYGPAFPVSLMNWALLYSAAQTAGAAITSGEGVTVCTEASTGRAHLVGSIAGFAPEMGCTVNGVAKTIDLVDPVTGALIFKTSFATSVGHVVQALPSRFLCDLTIDKQVAVGNALDMLMACCRGFLTYDSGRLAIAVEKSLSDSTWPQWALTTPTGAEYLGIIPGSVKFNQRAGNSNNYNKVEATYESGALLSGANRTASFSDADRGGMDFPKLLKIALPGVSTADQAMRCALPKLAKVAAMRSAAGQDESRGLSASTGPSGLRFAIGDFFRISREAFTSSLARITRVVYKPDLSVDVEVRPEAQLFRRDAFMGAIDPYTDTPDQAGEYGSGLATATLTLSVTQAAAGQLQATVGIAGYTAGPGTSAGTHVQRFTAIELHASTVAGFTPTTGSAGMGGTLVDMVDPTTTSFSWNVPEGLLEVPLYIKAVGLVGNTGAGAIISPEVPITIYRTDRPTSDPTQQEGSNNTNMAVDGDFATTSWLSDAAAPAYPGTIRDPLNVVAPATMIVPPSSGLTTNAMLTEPAAAAATGNIAKITDTSDTTYYGYDSTYDGSGSPTWVAGTFNCWGFGVGTGRLGRFVIRALRTTGSTGTIRIYWAMDRTAPVWNYYGIFSPGATNVAQDVQTPEVTGADLSKLVVQCEVIASQAFSAPWPKHFIGRVLRVYFEEKAASAYAGSVNGNLGTVYGDGTNYGNLRRAFMAGTQVAFTASTLNHVRLQVRKHVTTDTLDGNPLEIRIYDADSPANSWIIGSIPAAAVTSAWTDHAIKFSSVSAIAGTNLQIEVRTKNTKAIDVDKLLVARGDTLFAWTTSPQEQAAGYFGDFSNGDSVGFSKGSWVAGDRKTSTVA